MAQSTQDPRMAFVCQQYDQFASITRSYILMYYYEDKSIEMMEQKNGRAYLKRSPTKFPTSAFFIGASLNIEGKTTKITGYADTVTRQLLGEKQEDTVVIIAETSFASLGRYLSMITEECGFTIANVQMAWIKQEMTEEYDLPEGLANTRAVIVQCLRADAIEKGFSFMERATGTCCARDTVQSELWTQLCAATAASPLAVRGEQNCSVVVFKPSFVASNRVGNAIQQLVDLGLEPTALSQITLNSSRTHKFMKPYYGVLRDIDCTVQGFVGHAWIMQFISLDDSMSVVSAVRDECGPYDSIIAKKLFPKSIRGRYGKDHVDNVVHCCDLEGEGPIYTDFFFPPK